MGSTSQSSLAEVRTRIGTEGGTESTREGGGLQELSVTNLLEVGSHGVLKVPAVGEEAVGAEVGFLKTGGGVSRSQFVAFLLAPAALPKSTSNKAKSAPSSSRSSVAMLTLPLATT